MKHKKIVNLTLTAMFLAIGLVLPFLTGQIQQIGSMLLPMHIPVFLCALICGWRYGAPMAFVLPVMRSFLFGMPPLYPAAASMAFELMTYALVAGVLYEKFRRQGTCVLYGSLLAAMVAGRIVWGTAQFVFLGLKGTAFTFEAFLAGALLNAIPGIILQLILIPAIMLALHKTKLLPFRKPAEQAQETVEA